jgi:hypothetical protein
MYQNPDRRKGRNGNLISDVFNYLPGFISPVFLSDLTLVKSIKAQLFLMLKMIKCMKLNCLFIYLKQVFE